MGMALRWSALASLWGQRSKPLLVAVLDNEDEGVRIAALAALRKVGGVDENVVVRIEKMLNKGGGDLRAAAAAALADTLPHARAHAVAILRQALLPQAKGMLARIRGPAAATEEPLLVLALSLEVLVTCQRSDRLLHAAGDLVGLLAHEGLLES